MISLISDRGNMPGGRPDITPKLSDQQYIPSVRTERAEGLDCSWSGSARSYDQFFLSEGD